MKKLILCLFVLTAFTLAGQSQNNPDTQPGKKKAGCFKVSSLSISSGIKFLKLPNMLSILSMTATCSSMIASLYLIASSGEGLQDVSAAAAIKDIPRNVKIFFITFHFKGLNNQMFRFTKYSYYKFNTETRKLLKRI